MAFSGSATRNIAQFTAQQAIKNQGAAEDALLFGQGQALDTLGANYDAARGALNPYATTGGNAFNLLADSYGVNGQAGNDAAVSAFRSSPGYQYAVDQATDGAARKASSLGALGSGNTQSAITTLAGNLADQDYGSWRSGLQGLGQTGYNASKGISDLYGNQGTGEASIYQDTAGKRAQSLLTLSDQFGNAMKGVGQAGQDALKNNLSLGLNAAGSVLNGLKLLGI